MLDFYLLSVLIFIAALALLVYRDRKNFRREAIILLRKTKRGRGFITRTGTRFPRFWKLVGNIAVVVGFLVSAWGLLFLLQNAIRIATTPTATPGLAFLLPSPTTSAVMGPGFFAVPFWYWIISIALLALVHEGFHGIMSAMEGVKLKSLGWGILAVIPLAFVEPSERELRRKPALSQLRVFSAGSFANFLLAGVSVLLLAGLVSSAFVPAGVGYSALIKGYPAAGLNMSGPVMEISGHEIRDLSDMNRVLSMIGPGKKVVVITGNETSRRVYSLTTAPRPEPPAYSPGVFDGVVIGLEHAIPGAIEGSRSFNEWINPPQGVHQWDLVKSEISFWEYVEENYPSLAAKAGSRILELNAELENVPRPGFIGIANVVAVQEVRLELAGYAGVIDFSQGLLFFMFLINFGVGLANLLPIKPLDGGRMWEILLRKVVPKHSRPIVTALAYITLLLIIANFILPIGRLV